MKKTTFFVVVLSMLLSFPGLVTAKEKGKLYRVPHDQSKIIQESNPAAAQEQRERYILERDRKQEQHSRFAAVKGIEEPDKTNTVDIQLDSTYIYLQPDFEGDLYITGMCHNAGTSSAVFLKVHFNLYDSNWNWIGYDYNYVWGGSNVNLGGGIFTNALEAGDYGFFKVWTNFDYNTVKHWSYWFTWSTYSYTTANAQLAFDGDIYGEADYFGGLELSGLVKNSNSTYVTYFTQVAFAVFNTAGTSVVDVDFTYVDGSNYNYGTGTTDTAIYPYESQPFLISFPQATYAGTSDTFYYAFEWDEARASSMPELAPPFGEFATPINGANVYSSIPVTGWALDDSGVESVKIYLMQGNTQTYIGDAILVEGARPDVAAAYPGYPNNTRAGWGYMLLTNFLPNGGNGTYQLRAIVTDGVGKTTDLGTKTIYCDNAHAVKPFGAIDTPTQGGTASGSSFINWGWVLTPQPNSIPTNGSTINVYVDGVSIGHPTYNNYRADIASFFPGYANSNGAAGYFMLDTTGYANGVHTIQWTATDTGGNTDGIGSRYFSISNTGTSNSLKQTYTYKTNTKPQNTKPSQIAALPDDYSSPVRVKHGYDEDDDVIADLAPVNEQGMNQVVIQEMERLEIHLSDQSSNDFTYSGYLAIGNRLMKLPVGSTLDPKTGVFSWIPGPGYLGTFHLVFVETAPAGTMTKKNIIVEIAPKQY